MKDYKFIKNKRGFTIIEMLIAVLIFSLSITSLMVMSSKALKTSKNAEGQLVADYLAIEAIEVVHNLRDSAILKGLERTTWELVFQGGTHFFDNEGCFDGSGVCNFYPDNDMLVLDKCIKCNVFLSENSYYYYQIHEVDGASIPPGDTGYRRMIKIQKVTDGQVIVKVDIEWGKGHVTYLENLYLWQ